MKSQATPCARAPETPSLWATQGAGVGAPRAHGLVPCPRDPHAHGTNLPHAHEPIRMDNSELLLGLLFAPPIHLPIYFVPRSFVRNRKVYEMIM